MIQVDAPTGVQRSLYLGASPGRHPHTVLRQLHDYLPADTTAMGAGNPVTALEARTAELLGKQAALFLPTGKMAQQVALRIHADETHHRLFAAHPTCHLVHHELDGYAQVHGLDFTELGQADRLFTEADIRGLGAPVSTVVWELPQREIGGILPDWSTLNRQVAAVRDRGTRTHLDGARLWEAQTYYDRPFAEIASLFDSVYVSLYKTLQAPRGAVLAGSADFIDQARAWSVRLGGESAGNWPLAAAGLFALDHVLPQLRHYKDHALTLAKALNATGLARTIPDPPQTPFFFVTLPVSPQAASRAHTELCRATGLELFRLLRTTEHPRTCSFEISVGEAATTIEADEIAHFTSRLVRRAQDLDTLS
ncbi:threonine aldolase family protein [Streptomyces sp. NPDC055037]